MFSLFNRNSDTPLVIETETNKEINNGNQILWDPITKSRDEDKKNGNSLNLVVQDCNQFESTFGYYILVDRIFKTKLKAVNRATLLRKTGIENIAVISSGCFNNYLGSNYYLVHTNILYHDENEANIAASNLIEHKQKHNIEIAYNKPMKVK